ncbi:MAG: HAMP domain-containing protein [Anaerolineae bacterium]|nr:HAMP domain-containing protein [Anaerolineae bacterium]
MTLNPLRWFENRPIRVKLLFGFGVILLLMLIQNMFNYLIYTTTEQARQTLLAAQDEATMAYEISAQFQNARGVMADASIAFILEGLDTAVAYYNGSQTHGQVALEMIDNLASGESELGDTGDAEKRAALAALRANVIDYDSTIGLLRDAAAARGDSESRLGGDVVAPLREINEVFDAEAALTWVERYTNSVSQSAVLEIPKAFTNLQNDIEASDLSDDEKARLKDLLNQSRTAFSVLLQNDFGLFEKLDKMNTLSQSLIDQINDYVADRKAEQAEALEKQEDAQARRERYLPVMVGITLLVSILLAIELSRRITSPVRSLTETASQIANGNYDLRVENTTGDEVGRLGASFNVMVEAIAQREAELLKQTHELRIATAKAREAARVRREFLANVSHELRTPLNAILGFSDGLLMEMYGALNEKQLHKTRRLRENGIRLLALVDDILDLTRIESRRIELRPAPFSPGHLVDRMKQQMKSLADEKSLTLDTHLDPNLPDSLIGDEQRIEQVVVNLLSNAFKFTDQGSVSLAARAQPEQNTWLIEVKDTGIGIPPHAKDIIFEEFRQVDGSSTRARKGSGLGLAITRNLVRLMNGHIGVESDLGRGSTFTVTLPLITSINESEMTVGTSPELDSAGAVDGG